MKAKTAQKILKRHTAGSRPGIKPAKSLPIIKRQAAGIDVGAAEHSVCVPEDAVPAGESPGRQFGAFTAQLGKMVEWFREGQVAPVAMEPTGVYWRRLDTIVTVAGRGVG